MAIDNIEAGRIRFSELRSRGLGFRDPLLRAQFWA